MPKATVADLDAKISKAQSAKDTSLAKHRAELRELSARRDKALAEEAAETKVAEMSPAERQAIAAELERVGSDS